MFVQFLITRIIICFVAHLVRPLTCSDLKADESISEELEAAYVCKRRLEHLREHAGSNVPAGSGSSTGTVNLWRKRRLDRMLVEYFLRRGYYGAATRLAHRSDLRDLTNIGKDDLLRNLQVSLNDLQQIQLILKDIKH